MKSATEQDLAILDHYYNEGIKLVRLRGKDKKCIDQAWQLTDMPLEDVRDHVRQGGAVGWQVGEVSGWISGIDCDWPETRRLAPSFLPETLKGCKGQEDPSQYIYRSPGLGFESFKGLDGSEILAIKASNNRKGHQIVVPPSNHAVKGAYHFIGGFNPAAIAEISPDKLRRSVGMLAVSALISRHLPWNGRHHLAMAYAGYMLRNGEPIEDVTKMLVAAWEDRKSPREGVDDVNRIIRDTYDKISKNDPATGGRRLEELIPVMPAKIAKFLQWERPDMREIRQYYPPSDIGNAERFIDMYRDKVLWCPARKLWLVWDGTRWTWDAKMSILKLAHKAVRCIYKEAEREPDREKQKQIAKFALASQNESRINAMLSQAKPYLAVSIEELDTDPWLINCQNGTLDLRTGKLKNHDPADVITKIAPVDYNPEADCPRFKRFLKEILVEDAVIDFVKRYSGYSATGITRERLFAILYGFGKNGKTTLVELLRDVLGDYATNTDTETILMKRYQGVGNDVAALKGARFVSAAEIEKGRRLAESKVKQLTGSDTVTARFLFGEPFNFKPEFKLWLSTNNKPVIQGTDDAIWDRIRLIPFTQRFEGDKADPKLPEKLREELPGVFAWIVEGCLEWQEHGLKEPESVSTATEQYREEMDTLAAFLEDRCIVREGLVAPATPLYKEYRLWCDDGGEKPETQKMFGMRLRERGFVNAKITSGPHKDRKGWFRIGLKADHPDPQDPDKTPRSTPQVDHDRPLMACRADDRPPDKDSGFAGKTFGSGGEEDHSGPKNQSLQGKNAREDKDLEKRSASSAPSAATSRRLTKEEAQEVQRLISEGMAATFARAEVLGLDVEGEV